MSAIAQYLHDGIDFVENFKTLVKKQYVDRFFSLIADSSIREKYPEEYPANVFSDDFVRIGFFDIDNSGNERKLKPSNKFKYAMVMMRTMYELHKSNIPAAISNVQMDLDKDMMGAVMLWAIVDDKLKFNEQKLIADKEFMEKYENLLREQKLI